MVSGFNGAALRRARSLAWCCFAWREKNASTGPRSGERGVNNEVEACRPLEWLQRGRAPESAESARGHRPRGQGQPASTGPRSGERGVKPVVDRRRAKTKRFNGAALRRARSRVRGDLGAGRGLGASTGPRSGERGVVPPRHRAHRRHPASTGPRSGERGVAREVAADAARLDASTGPRSGERGVRQDEAEVVGGGLASTGPRSGERGVIDDGVAKAVGAIASTGPRSGERGVGTLASGEAGASQKPLCERRAPCGSRARIAFSVCFISSCLSVCERPGARGDHARARVLAVKKQAVLSGDHGVTPHNTAGRKCGRPGPAR